MIRLPHRLETESGFCGARVVSAEATDALWRGLPEGVDGLVVVPSRQNERPPLSDASQHLEVACVQVLVLIDDEKILFHAREVGVVCQRFSEQVGQLRQERIAKDVAVFGPRTLESGAQCRIDFRVISWRECLPVRLHFAKEHAQDLQRDTDEAGQRVANNVSVLPI